MIDVLKTLTIKCFHIEAVNFADNIEINKGILSIPKSAQKTMAGIIECNISIINPNHRDVMVNSIMDIVPISTKVYGELGSGITHTLTGTYALICAKLSNGEQVKNFGCCFGNLKDIVIPDRASTYGIDDILIHFDLVLDETFDQKQSIYSAHLLVDTYIQKIRENLKLIDGTLASEVHTFKETVNKNSKKVAIIKQVSGQGAMENNLIFPNEPSGMEGGKTIMELQNMPIVISPNEYRDGAIRALT